MLTIVIFATANFMAVAQYSPLTLELSTKSSFVRREPIPLELNIKNPTSQPATWYSQPMCGGNMSLIVRKPDGSVWVSGIENGLYKPIPHNETTKSGAHKRITVLADDGFLKLLAQPGSYQIQVEFAYSDITSGQFVPRRVLSNLAVLQVLEPHGRDRLALTYIESIIDPANRQLESERGLEALEFFYSNFRDSVYGNWKAIELGKRYVSVKRFPAAEAVFFDISDIDFYYTQEVERQLNNLAIKLHKVNARTKRISVPSNAPFFREIEKPDIRPIPIPPIPAPVIVSSSTPLPM